MKILQLNDRVIYYRALREYYFYITVGRKKATKDIVLYYNGKIIFFYDYFYRKTKQINFY